MKHHDIVLRALLAVIALLLFLNLTIPVERTLAGYPPQYKVVLVDFETRELQAALDRYGRQGWEVVLIEPAVGHLIFKK